MQVSDFDFDLPAELIAQRPLPERAASRLLVLNGQSGRLEDRRFAELPALLQPGDLLVLNDTRVIPARLRGRKASGGRIEMLLERITGPCTASAQLRASRAPAVGARLSLVGGAQAVVEARSGDLFELRFDRNVDEHLLEHGEVPLPPYIDRPVAADDAQRYQTIYAARRGAVAAPTAGLHFDAAVFDTLEKRGIERACLTLHVGAGTFAPLRAERLADNRLHAERAEVSEALCRRIAAVKARGGRVVAVGTTAVRALETAALPGKLAPYSGETEIFIYPGFCFRVVDAIITNFHLPRSSLLMLVAAFAGLGPVMAAYEHAVAQRYRFFSYGDAMLVLPLSQQPLRTAGSLR
jgi:S-adenosylmethionine:tRNA ribosyltransferase-isomerase